MAKTSLKINKYMIQQLKQNFSAEFIERLKINLNF